MTNFRTVLFGLCGNEYTASIVTIGTNKKFNKILHRSNSIGLFNKAKSVFNLCRVVFIRTFCMIVKVRFVMCVPHCCNSFGIFLKVLRPDDIYIVDDGMTFAYWSKFHDQHIAPLLDDNRLIGLIGPENPKWNLSKYSSIKIKCVPRKKIVEKMIHMLPLVKSNPIVVGDSISKFFVIIDDGCRSENEFVKMMDILSEKHKALSIIILHPARKNLIKLDAAIRLNVSVERFVLENYGNVCGVIGFGSTALLNLASLNPDFQLISLFVSNAEINETMITKGVCVRSCI